MVKADGLAREKIGDDVRIKIDPQTCHLFDGEGKTLVNGSLI